MGRLVKGMFGNRCSRSVGGNGQSFATCGKCLLSEATGMVRNVQVCSVSHRLFHRLFTVFHRLFTAFHRGSAAAAGLPSDTFRRQQRCVRTNPGWPALPSAAVTTRSMLIPSGLFAELGASQTAGFDAVSLCEACLAMSKTIEMFTVARDLNRTGSLSS